MQAVTYAASNCEVGTPRAGYLDLMDAQEQEMRMLAERRGTARRDPRVDHGSPEVRLLPGRLTRHWLDGSQTKPGDRVKALAEILAAARNNQSHARKHRDDAEDRRLLSVLNPVLLDSVGRRASDDAGAPQ